MQVDRELLPHVDQLGQSLVDEDDADEGGEGFLGEAGDVADQRAGVRGDQQDAQEGRPQPDARPQGQVGQTVIPGDRQRDVTLHQDAILVLLGSEPEQPTNQGFM